jgi:hypothetical protein
MQFGKSLKKEGGTLSKYNYSYRVRAELKKVSLNIQGVIRE